MRYWSIRSCSSMSLINISIYLSTKLKQPANIFKVKKFVCFTGKTLSNGDNIHYFFSRVGESRATESGYWKDVLMDEPIFCSANGDEVGIKKYHIFFAGDQEEDNCEN